MSWGRWTIRPILLEQRTFHSRDVEECPDNAWFSYFGWFLSYDEVKMNEIFRSSKKGVSFNRFASCFDWSVFNLLSLDLCNFINIERMDERPRSFEKQNQIPKRSSRGSDKIWFRRYQAAADLVSAWALFCVIESSTEAFVLKTTSSLLNVSCYFQPPWNKI